MTQTLQINFHEVPVQLGRYAASRWIEIASGSFKVCAFLTPRQMQTLAAAITAEYGSLPVPVTVESEIINVAGPIQPAPTPPTIDMVPSSDEVPF